MKDHRADAVRLMPSALLALMLCMSTWSCRNDAAPSKHATDEAHTSASVLQSSKIDVLVLRSYAGRELPSVTTWMRRVDGRWDRRCLIRGILLLRSDGIAEDSIVTRIDTRPRVITGLTCSAQGADGTASSVRGRWRTIGDSIELARGESKFASRGGTRRGRWHGDTLTVVNAGHGTNGEPYLSIYVREQKRRSTSAEHPLSR